MEKYQIKDITPGWKLQEPVGREQVTNPATIHQLVTDYYKAKNLDPTKEHCVCAILNRAHQVLGFNLVSTGSVSSTVVHPREVFKPAISLSASAIILVHNHPTGDLNESEKDINMTKNIQKSGDILGIPLIDHLIVSFQKESFRSLRESGILK